MRNAAVAFAAIIVLLIAALLLSNSRLTSKAAIAEREVAELRLSIERADELRKADAAMMAAQFKTIAAFDAKIKELKAHVAALPDRDAECLSADDTERLRTLWQE